MPLEAIKELQKAIDKLKSVLQPDQCSVLQQPTIMEQQSDNQRKEVEESPMEVPSKVATQLEAVAKGTKIRSYTLAQTPCLLWWLKKKSRCSIILVQQALH